MELGPRAKEYFGIGADGLTDDQRRIKELEDLIEDACKVFEHYDLPEHAFHYRRELDRKQ